MTILLLVFLALCALLALGRLDPKPVAPRPWRVCCGTRDKSCGKILTVGEPGGYTTHTLCPDCAKAFDADIDRLLSGAAPQRRAA